ncbi:hypothetical protein KSP40_PGU013094 [Platanthera guangdongensis]|uniref:Uncharacterized protein n=1 Tax=Platanthera guangdongensis TaxID=2320717 RepID=A0ABR2MZR6_9ASPA
MGLHSLKACDNFTRYLNLVRSCSLNSRALRARMVGSKQLERRPSHPSVAIIVYVRDTSSVESRSPSSCTILSSDSIPAAFPTILNSNQLASSAVITTVEAPVVANMSAVIEIGSRPSFTVSKLGQLSKLARDNNTTSKTIKADRLHTMFLVMTDARVVLMKLADKLHDMMTVGQTIEICKRNTQKFCSLANRLWIFTWKEKLENLCFKHLHPGQYNDISSKLNKYFDEQFIASTIEKLEEALKKEVVCYHILCDRQKSLYNIYWKMLKYMEGWMIVVLPKNDFSASTLLFIFASPSTIVIAE